MYAVYSFSEESTCAYSWIKNLNSVKLFCQEFPATSYTGVIIFIIDFMVNYRVVCQTLG